MLSPPPLIDPSFCSPGSIGEEPSQGAEAGWDGGEERRREQASVREFEKQIAISCQVRGQAWRWQEQDRR